jgi:hypothetical protein
MRVIWAGTVSEAGEQRAEPAITELNAYADERIA